MEEGRGGPASPTELGLRFGLPIAGMGEMTGLGEAGPGAAGAMTTSGVLPGDSLIEAPLEDGLQAVPGQSGAEGLGVLPRAPKQDPWLGP